MKSLTVCINDSLVNLLGEKGERSEKVRNMFQKFVAQLKSRLEIFEAELKFTTFRLENEDMEMVEFLMNKKFFASKAEVMRTMLYLEILQYPIADLTNKIFNDTLLTEISKKIEEKKEVIILPIVGRGKIQEGAIKRTDGHLYICSTVKQYGKCWVLVE